MKTFLKSNFFWTKVLPTIFTLCMQVGLIYPFSALTAGKTIIVIALTAILLLNLYLKRNWISQILGFIQSSIFVFLVFAVISEYREFPNGATFEALQLLLVGFVFCLFAIAMGIS